jgi:hypothetical protein
MNIRHSLFAVDNDNNINLQYLLISGFHRALLQSVTFISRLIHSVIQNVDIKIYVL